MIELTEKQLKTVHDLTPTMHEIHRSQLINAIEQALSGTWSTARLKESAAWERVKDNFRSELSRIVDLWLYKAAGHSGCNTDASVRAYYGSTCTHSPIMPSKLIV